MQARDSQRTRQPPPRGRTAAINIALAVIAMLGIALGLRLANRGELISHGVVIGVQGCNTECTARLARSLSDRLSALGFDAAAPQGERNHAFDGPETVREFARTHGARFAVMLRVAVERSTPLVGAAGTRVGANATLYVMDASARGAPRPSYTLRAVDEADDEATAITLLGARFAQALFPVAGAELLGSEAVKTMLNNASGLEQQAAALAFKRRQRELRERDDAIREYRLDCEANDAALGSVEDGHCVSDGCAEEYLVGLLARRAQRGRARQHRSRVVPARAALDRAQPGDVGTAVAGAALGPARAARGGRQLRVASGSVARRKHARVHRAAWRPRAAVYAGAARRRAAL